MALSRDHSLTIKSLIAKLYSLVEVNGFEPMTSCVQGRRSPN